MKKLLFFAVAGICLCGLIACKDEAKNPGDYNLKPTLSFDPAYALSVDGTTKYNFTVRREIDTTFWSYYTKEDTLESGKIITDTVKYQTKKTAHYYDMDTVVLEAKTDTFTVHIVSNALWKAPVFAFKKAQWFFNYNLKTKGTSLFGGGNSNWYFYVKENTKNKRRAEKGDQYIFTSDSTVMYHFVFDQKAKNE